MNLQAQTVDINVTRNFIYFCFNYPMFWIEKVWADDKRLAEHFRLKYSNLVHRHGTTQAPFRFFTQLSSNHQAKLIKWVSENYSHKL